MSTKVMITGAGGFVGRHLAFFLAKEEEVEVLGVDLHLPWLEKPGERCEAAICDIMDRELVFYIVDRFRPDYVFHLAAQSSVKRSWEDPRLTYDLALTGQANLLDAVREAGNHAVVHVACSSEEYGQVGEEDLPIREEQPLHPASPYALSKVVQDYHALFCHRAYGTKTIRTRAFNMIGPGQSPEFVVSDFARQIAEVEAGMREAVIRVGNLEARRDFSDVRDLVGVYWDLVHKGEPGEVYNVCSGSDHSIREILDIMLGLSKVNIEVELDPVRMRKADIPVLRGDNGKMCALADFRPRHSLQETLSDVLDWWRGEVGGNH